MSEKVEPVEETARGERIDTQKREEVDPLRTASKSVSDTTDADTLQDEPMGDKPLDEEAYSEIEKLKKHDAAVLLVKKARHMVEDTEKQLDSCRLLLEEDLKSYNEVKRSLVSHALEESRSLLTSLGYHPESEEESEEQVVVFEPKEEVPSFDTQDVSIGKIGAFMTALFASAVMFTGLIYLATEKIGITLDVTKIPDHETATKVLGWYATLFGAKPDLFLGGAFVVLVSAFVFGVVYGIKIATRAKRNLSFAKMQLEKAREYAKHKSNCKEEMDKVDAHMNDAIDLLKTYEVVLGEQNGKLRRILHIEGFKEDINDYHDSSVREMHDTDMLLGAIKNFIDTPMSEEGRLSGKSTMFLHSAKSKLQKFLDRYYG